MKHNSDFYIHILTNMRDNIAKRKKPIEQIMDDHISDFGESTSEVCELQEEALSWALEVMEKKNMPAREFELLTVLYRMRTEDYIREAELLNRFLGKPDGGVNGAKSDLKSLLRRECAERHPKNKYLYRITSLGIDVYEIECKKRKKKRIKVKTKPMEEMAIVKKPPLKERLKDFFENTDPDDVMAWLDAALMVAFVVLIVAVVLVLVVLCIHKLGSPGR